MWWFPIVLYSNLRLLFIVLMVVMTFMRGVQSGAIYLSILLAIELVYRVFLHFKRR